MQLTFTSSARLLALASLVVLSACDKKKNGADPAAPILYGMSWTVDGSNVSNSAGYTISNGMLVLTSVVKASTGTDASTVTITVPAATGTYDLGVAVPGKSYTASYQTYLSGVSTTYIANNITRTGSGSVTVSTLGTEDIIGSFEFTGLAGTGTTAANKTITNGKFSIRRQ
jgi:hypothetical protein